MDILIILAGAIIGGMGFITLGGIIGKFVGIIGIVVFVIGLVINHRRHQGRHHHIEKY
ncbi:MAG: hypothetical protein JW915_04180 [Chitinispirillaceae bacterium]|nr:hypothetical protein [Chitinispirillaceae bacterium]